MDRGKRKVVGVLGGMGPAATAMFFQQVVEKTPAELDQDHLRILIDNNPTLPNRHDAIEQGNNAPAEGLVDMARGLEAQGAELIVMPCNTAHIYAEAIAGAVAIPFIDGIAATCDAMEQRKPAAKRVGILAADGCMRAGLYQRALAARGREPVGLGHAELERFMEAVYRIKRGEREPALGKIMGELADDLAARGAEAVIAGCTEVPLVLADDSPFYPLIDSLDAIAQRTVDVALGRASA